MCVEHAALVRAAEASNFKERIAVNSERLVTLCRRVGIGMIKTAPTVVYEHRVTGGHGEFKGLSQEQLRALRVGGHCPEHGRACLVADIAYSGRFGKKPWGATCRMAAWQLRGGLAINVAGKLLLDAPNVLAFGPERIDMLKPQSRLENLAFDTYLDDICNRVEGLISLPH